MKRLLVSLLCVVLLCGCSEVTESSSAGHYTFEIAAEGVWVYCDGERVQLLEADTADLLSFDNPEDYLTHNDFDFDQYPDLFVPELLGRPNIPGKYFHFDAKTGLFAAWEEMNEFGYISDVNDTDETLSFTVKGSAVDRKTTVCEWQEGALVKLGYEVQYASGSEVYIDNYIYVNGAEKLFRRERVLFSETGDWLGTEEVTEERKRKE